VADLAGGTWPALARHAAVVLTRDLDQAASVSDRIRLLADCRTAFGEADALPSITIVARLRADPEAPWCEPAPAPPPSGWPPCSLTTTSAPRLSGSESPSARSGATTAPTSPTHGRVTAPRCRGTRHNRHKRPRPAQTRDGLKRVTDRSVTAKTSVTGLSCGNDLMTDVTGPPVRRRQRRCRMTADTFPVDQLYRVPDAMRLLSMSRTVIYEQLRSGRLRSVHQGRARLIPAAAIRDYIALLESEAQAESQPDMTT
jgi:hypothetical protein